MTEEKKQQGGEKVTIVLAEDDKFISRAYKDGLGRAGFNVVQAVDGVEAMKLIRETSPGIVLLDLIMPIKNGFEVLEEMKGDDSLKDIPVLILSNLGQSADIEKGRELGAKDYLIKSNISMNEVIEKIKSCLNK